MTIQEFNNMAWSVKMLAEHKPTKKTYKVVGVDFGEKLVGLAGMVENEPEVISWCRCENVGQIVSEEQESRS